MPMMHIYRDGTKIEDREFQHNFFIVTWDNQLRWGQRTPPTWEPAGAILIQMNNISFKPMLNHVTSGWQVILDGVEIEADVTSKIIDIEEKTVELRYKNYSFVCYIPKIEYEPGSKIAEWRALFT
jgi:hypothetical protein